MGGLVRSDFMMRKYVAALFVLSVFVPYFKVLPNFGGEIQPNSLILGVGFILISGFVVHPKAFYLPLIVLVGSIFVAFLGGDVFYSARGVYSYLSFYVITISSYLFFCVYGELGYKFIRNILVAYLLVGLLQIYLDPNFFHSFLVRENGYGGIGGRGVESMTSEPTYYGLILLLTYVYVLSSRSIELKEKRKLYFLLFVSLVFVSRSTTAIFGFLVYLAFLSLRRSVVAYIVPASLVAVVLFYVFHDEVLQSRFYSIFSMLVNGGISGLIDTDQSSNDRLLHVFFSLKGFFDAAGFPRGFSDWLPYINLQSQLGYDVVYVSTRLGKVFPFIGSALFELGFFGLLLVFYVFYVLFKRFSGVNLIASVVVFVYLLFQALTIAFPLVPFVLSFFLFQSKFCRASYCGVAESLLHSRSVRI